MDLLFYEKLKGVNDKYIGFLNIININTKKVYVIPIKNKTGKHITE